MIFYVLFVFTITVKVDSVTIHVIGTHGNKHQKGKTNVYKQVLIDDYDLSSSMYNVKEALDSPWFNLYAH